MKVLLGLCLVLATALLVTSYELCFSSAHSFIACTCMHMLVPDGTFYSKYVNTKKAAVAQR